jgi:DNA-binding transcriptional ArsR family regulator
VRGKAHDAPTRTAPHEPPAVRVEPILPAANLDRVIHERARLGIVSVLAANETLTFTDLKQLLDLTDGNLSIHARKLEEAGYVTCTKRFEGRTPRTEFRLTIAGRRALTGYLDHMDALIRAMRGL